MLRDVGGMNFRASVKTSRGDGTLCRMGVVLSLIGGVLLVVSGILFLFGGMLFPFDGVLFPLSGAPGGVSGILFPNSGMLFPFPCVLLTDRGSVWIIANDALSLMARPKDGRGGFTASHAEVARRDARPTCAYS